MIIERHDIDTGTPFKELKDGTVFLYDDIVYMKIQTLLDGRFNIECNAIRLSDGYLGSFDGVDVTYPRPNSYLVIE